MKKYAVVLVSATIVLMSGFSSASAREVRPTLGIRDSLPRPTGRIVVGECTGSHCKLYDCRETDDQSICDYVAYCMINSDSGDLECDEV